MLDESTPTVPLPTKDEGYTLVELMVVIAILGMLTAIAVPYVIHYLDTAKINTAKTEVVNLTTSLDLFRIDVGRYPTSQEGLRALITAPEGVDNWGGPYIKSMTALKDPWGHAYYYLAPGEHGDFDLYSNGAGGRAVAGGKPPISNW